MKKSKNNQGKKRPRRQRGLRLNAAQRQSLARPSFPLTYPPRQTPTMNPWPEETDTTLEWNLFAGQVNAGLAEMNIRWYTNAAMSPDIVTPANRSNGFTQWAAMYRFSRVISYQAICTVTNKEVFPVTFLFRNTNIDPGTGTGQFAFAGESFSRTCMVSALTGGSNVKSVSMSHTIAAITGTDIEYDDSYKATSTTQAPGNLTFLGLSARSADGGSLFSAAGIAYHIKIRMKVRFTERELVNDTVRNPHTFQHYVGSGEQMRNTLSSSGQ